MKDDKSPFSRSRRDTLPVKCGSLLVLKASSNCLCWHAEHIAEGEVAEGSILCHHVPA